MEKKSVEYDKVSNYKGLEIFLTPYLNQVEYKSDLIILLAHYILNQTLDYNYVVQESDPYLDNKVDYKIFDMLPFDWNRLPGSYKLTYKKDETIKIVSGMKQNNSFVLYVLKENGDRDEISAPIPLKRYIPDEFFNVDHAQYKNLRALQVGDIMNVITGTILGNKKFKFKKELDIGNLDDTNKHLQEILLETDEKMVPKLLDDSDDNPVGSLLPSRCEPNEEDEIIGEKRLQDVDSNIPEDVNQDVDFRAYHHPDYYMQEDVEGEPTSSLYS